MASSRTTPWQVGAPGLRRDDADGEESGRPAGSVLGRVSKLVASLLFRLSMFEEKNKAELDQACNAFIGIPQGVGVGASLNTISSRESLGA